VELDNASMRRRFSGGKAAPMMEET